SVIAARRFCFSVPIRICHSGGCVHLSTLFATLSATCRPRGSYQVNASQRMAMNVQAVKQARRRLQFSFTFPQPYYFDISDFICKSGPAVYILLRERASLISSIFFCCGAQ
ncbi:unnamed protein product, partial [Scytosiphon promiscuus]